MKTSTYWSFYYTAIPASDSEIFASQPTKQFLAILVDLCYNMQMRFWAPDFANISGTERREFTFPDQPEELVEAIYWASEEERKRRKLSPLTGAIDVEVRTEIETLGVTATTENKRELLCYNLEVPDFEEMLRARGLFEKVSPMLGHVLRIAEPYLEGRLEQHF
jgi:hypothetical protein